ncbi:MAG: protein kinase [Candidatus Eremiobacteraeota bacterium]|nr:protein kinase [Candidatus Eremiobacteraeota bacterium]
MNKTLSHRYDLQDLIVKGRTCLVYRAFDRLLDRTVVIKLAQEEWIKKSPQYKAVFAREAQYLAKLEHPNILPLYDFGLCDQSPFITSQIVYGGDVGQMVRQLGNLPPEMVVSIAAQVASAIDHCRNKGYAHRDIKPDNILINTSLHIYLADFGLACEFESPEYKKGVGTYLFLAPEQLYSSPFLGIGQRCDQFSLGVTIYFMLTGRLPLAKVPEDRYRSLKKEIRQCTAFRLMNNEKIIPISELIDISPYVYDVIQQMMAINPEERFATSSESINKLQQALDKTLPRNVFISYSRKDDKYVANVVDQLLKIGINCWWDKMIPRGKNWDREIEKQLKECKAMLVILTENSVKSEEVQDEWSYWRYLNKPIVTLVCGDCKIPYRLHRRHHILAEDRSLEEIIGELAEAFPMVRKAQKARKSIDDSYRSLKEMLEQYFQSQPLRHETPKTEAQKGIDLYHITSVSPDKILENMGEMLKYVPARYSTLLHDDLLTKYLQ